MILYSYFLKNQFYQLLLLWLSKLPLFILLNKDLGFKILSKYQVVDDCHLSQYDENSNFNQQRLELSHPLQLFTQHSLCLLAFIYLHFYSYNFLVLLLLVCFFYFKTFLSPIQLLYKTKLQLLLYLVFFNVNFIFIFNSASKANNDVKTLLSHH